LADPLPRYVVDASVATKWHLRDEQYTSQADAVLAAYRDGRIDLVAPDHFRYEVPSAVRNALRTGRLTVEQARTAIADFLAWQIPTVGGDALILAAYDQATRFGCSLYDGLYLALADAAQCPLVFADHRLRNAIGVNVEAVIWLEDWT
jgi:predicted nucleic acid-binding protein